MESPDHPDSDEWRVMSEQHCVYPLVQYDGRYDLPSIGFATQQELTSEAKHPAPVKDFRLRLVNLDARPLAKAHTLFEGASWLHLVDAVHAVAEPTLAVQRQLNRLMISRNGKHVRTVYFILDNDHVRELSPEEVANEVKQAGVSANHAHTADRRGVLVEYTRSDNAANFDTIATYLKDRLIITPGAAGVSTSVGGGVKIAEAPKPTVASPRSVPAEEARRETLLAKQWPTSIAVGQRAGSQSSNPSQWTKARRDSKQLLGVWDLSAKTFRHPDFQFESDGRIKLKVKELLAALAEHPRMTAETDPDGWRRAYWLYQPFRSLSRRYLAFEALKNAGGADALRGTPEEAAAFMTELLDAGGAPEDKQARTPAEVFAENPEAVIELAKKAAAEARPEMDAEGRLRDV